MWNYTSIVSAGPGGPARGPGSNEASGTTEPAGPNTVGVPGANANGNTGATRIRGQLALLVCNRCWCYARPDWSDGTN